MFTKDFTEVTKLQTILFSAQRTVGCTCSSRPEDFLLDLDLDFLEPGNLDFWTSWTWTSSRPAEKFFIGLGLFGLGLGHCPSF